MSDERSSEDLRSDAQTARDQGEEKGAALDRAADAAERKETAEEEQQQAEDEARGEEE